MEVKVADSKGRIYLGKWYANKKLYVVNLGGVIVLTPYTVFAKELEKVNSVEALLGFLKSISPEELKDALRDSAWRKLES